MKRICFDLRALQIGHENRGIGMYIRSVLENLEPSDDIEYLFYCFDSSDPIKKLHIDTVKYTLVQTKTLKTSLDSPKNILSVFRLISHRFGDLKSYRPDTFVQFDFMLGMPSWRKMKKVVIGYDLIPLIMKSEYMPTLSFVWHHSFGKRAKIKGVLRSLYYKMRYKLHYRVYKKADKVVCISKTVAKSFETMLHVAPEKISTIPLAPVISKSKPSSTHQNRIDKPYIFYIGGTDTRKRIVDVVKAFNIARGRGSDIKLALAGNEFSELETMPDLKARKAITDSPYRQHIHLLGFVSDEEKMDLYASAQAFVFASTYEGFGLPVVEAMSASCPVITYNNSSIPEAAGNAAIMVTTGDFVGIANSILDLENEKVRKSYITKGIKQANLFTWDRYIKEFSKIL